jgi:hypothetical protein
VTTLKHRDVDVDRYAAQNAPYPCGWPVRWRNLTWLAASDPVPATSSPQNPNAQNRTAQNPNTHAGASQKQVARKATEAA